MSSMYDYQNLSALDPMAGFRLSQMNVAPQWLSAPAGDAPVMAPSPVLGKAALDGTNSFGANSAPGAWGDRGSMSGNGAAGNQPGMWGQLSEWMKTSGMLGSKDLKTGEQTQGWGGLALGGAQALGSLYMGMQQYNLAKETLAANKEQFNKNYEAQRTTTNSSLEDRQRARVASNQGAYQSVNSYMQQNGVK